MSHDIVNHGNVDGLPEPLQKVVRGVQDAGKLGGTIGGVLVGVPLSLAATLGTKLIGQKGDDESHAIGQRVFEISTKVGETIGTIAPVAVLAATFLLWRHLSKRS